MTEDAPNGQETLETLAVLAARNEEKRKTLRGRIRRVGAWGLLTVLLVTMPYVAVIVFASDAVAAHVAQNSDLISEIYLWTVLGFGALAGVDGIVDAMGKRR